MKIARRAFNVSNPFRIRHGYRAIQKNLSIHRLSFACFAYYVEMALVHVSPSCGEIFTKNAWRNYLYLFNSHRLTTMCFPHAADIGRAPARDSVIGQRQCAVGQCRVPGQLDEIAGLRIQTARNHGALGCASHAR